MRANAPSALAPRLCANTTGRAVGGADDADDGEKSLPADMCRFIGEAAADDSAGVSAGELGDSDAIVCTAVNIFAASFSPFISACSSVARVQHGGTRNWQARFSLGPAIQYSEYTLLMKVPAFRAATCQPTGLRIPSGMAAHALKSNM